MVQVWPRYPYPTITHTTLSCLAFFKHHFSLVISLGIFVIFSVFIFLPVTMIVMAILASSICCFTLLLHERCSVLDNKYKLTVFLIHIFAFFLPVLIIFLACYNENYWLALSIVLLCCFIKSHSVLYNELIFSVFFFRMFIFLLLVFDVFLACYNDVDRDIG